MAWTIFTLSARLLYRRLGILLGGNLLWLLLSLPLVTCPAATAGLYYLAHRVVREERALDPEYARLGDFWVGVRRFGARATLLALLNLAAFAFLLFTFGFYWTREVEWLRWVSGPVAVVGVLWGGAQLYLFPLLIASPDDSPPLVARRALVFALGHPLDSALLTVWLLIVAFVSALLAGPAIFVLFAFVALTQTLALRVMQVQQGEIAAAILPEEGRNRKQR